MDITGPLTPTKQGNRYVLVVGNYFTKWMEAYTIPNQEEETLARVLVEEFIPRYGVPEKIHSHQRPNFGSALFNEVGKILGMKKTRTTQLWPQSNHIVDCFNRTLR